MRGGVSRGRMGRRWRRRRRGERRMRSNHAERSDLGPNQILFHHLRLPMHKIRADMLSQVYNQGAT
jgi:hypothetical protein